MKLDNNNHSVFVLRYYVILVVSSPTVVIKTEMVDYLSGLFIKAAESYRVVLEKTEFGKHWIGFLFRTKPNTKLSGFINVYKSISSRLIKKEFPGIQGQQFWSHGYCLLTVGELPTREAINDYVKSQIKC